MSRLILGLLLAIVGSASVGCTSGLSGNRVIQDQWEPPVSDKTPK